MADNFIIAVLAVLAVYFGVSNFIAARKAEKLQGENSDLKLKELLDGEKDKVMSSDLDDLIDSNNRRFKPGSEDKKG